MIDETSDEIVRLRWEIRWYNAGIELVRRGLAEAEKESNQMRAERDALLQWQDDANRVMAEMRDASLIIRERDEARAELNDARRCNVKLHQKVEGAADMVRTMNEVAQGWKQGAIKAERERDEARALLRRAYTYVVNSGIRYRQPETLVADIAAALKGAK